VSFLRRLLGRGAEPEAGALDEAEPSPQAGAGAGAEDARADETDDARDLDVLRAEQARLDDLAQRQLRYARYAWTPPRQGGARRSGDEPAAGKDD
jgi:hypothetical protein